MREAMVVGLIGGALVVLGTTTAMAQRYESDNYTIDASVGNSFGGDSLSAGYRLTSSGGESLIGNGAGGSYMLDQGYVAQLSRSLQLSVQPKGLVAYWPMNETSGDKVYDNSSNQHTAQFVGSPEPTRVSGKVGQALDFDGSNQVSVPISADFNIGSQGFTMSAWIKGDSFGNTYNMFMGRHLPYFNVRSNGKLHMSMNAAGAQRSVLGTTTLATDSWYHVTTTYDSEGYMKVYLDGELDGAAGPFLAATDYNYPFLIGSWSGGAGYSFNGAVDEAKYFSRALSAAEIEADYEAGLAGGSAGLAFDGEVIPGASRTTEAEAVVQTDAPGYNLTIEQDNNLTSGSYNIPSLSGSIGSPIAWDEGSTKGLGFTLTSTNATTIPAKWNSGNSYAPLPNNSTSFYNRSGFSGGDKDVIGLRYRLDVATDQPTGQYKNTVTYTGVITP